ncbi:flagellar motor protein MotB [bacterium]|nr:flagellar motor protein MotB [bacterium]
MAKKKKQPVEEGIAAWMATYGDMVTLLMTFFILIVSFSTTELIKFRKAMGSLRGSMGVLLEQDGSSIIAKQNQSTMPNMQSQVMMKSMEDIERYVFEMQIENGVGIEMREGGLTIRLNSALLFMSGDTEIKPIVYPILDHLAMMVIMLNCKVRVEGHTDSLPIRTARFNSNWELAWHRAFSVVKYFVDVRNLSPLMFSTNSLGEFRPLLPNTSVENRAKNRRVEILLDFDDIRLPR